MGRLLGSYGEAFQSAVDSPTEDCSKGVLIQYVGSDQAVLLTACGNGRPLGALAKGAIADAGIVIP
jgi:hypothetical protein